MHILLLFLAKYLIYIIGLVAVIYWFTVPKAEKIRLVIYGVIAGIVTVVLVKIGSSLYYDPRPFVSHHVTPLYPHGPDNGFPSDHTFASAFVALVIYSSNKRLGAALFVGAVLIGLARIIGHIHSPIDIVGSLVFAAIGSLAAWYLTPLVQRRLTSGSDQAE